MDKNDSLTPQENKGNNRQVMIISLMVMAVLLIAELYVMTNLSSSFVALIIITVLFLGSAYVFGNSILKELQENKLRAEEQYDAITKANKASYILLKKAYEQLEEMESKSAKPTEEIISAQKAIAKVTISRNKENTDAMMNSNDKVLEKIFDFEENLENNQSELFDKQRHMIDDSMKELMLKQQEMASSMKVMEATIKSELLQAINSMQVAQPQPTVMMQEVPMEPTMDFGVSEEPEVTVDLGFVEEPNSGEELGFGEDMSLGEDLGLGENISLGEDLGMMDTMDLGISEELSPEDMGISEDIDFTADLALSKELSLGADFGLGEDLGLGDVSSLEEDLGFSEEMSLGEDLGLGDAPSLGEDLGFSEEMSFDEDLGLGDSEEMGISADLDLGIDLLPEEELITEPVAEPMMEAFSVEPEFEKEQDAGFPELSNPNKLMTPEEIAALIAKM